MSLRIAVIGVGHLGRHHARILASLPGAELVAVVGETVRKRLEVYSQQTRPLVDYREVLGGVDAVTLAVPTELHREIALPFLSAGVPVLVEKPMARSLEEADEMIAAAARAKVVLAVGHTERFNPAVAAARPLLVDPRFIEVHRLGTFPERSLDIDVVFDLMIHDLDVVLSLVKSEVESIDAVGVPVLTGRVDIANAQVSSRAASQTSPAASPRPRPGRSVLPAGGMRVIDRGPETQCGGSSRATALRPRFRAATSTSPTKSRSSAARRLHQGCRVAPCAGRLGGRPPRAPTFCSVDYQ
jgi:predicted dehydrogenase